MPETDAGLFQDAFRQQNTGGDPLTGNLLLTNVITYQCVIPSATVGTGRDAALLSAASLTGPRAADGIGLRTGRDRRLSARGRSEIFER